YYQHFLGVDVLELAARVSDAAAVTAKYKVPTMEASECVVCHKTLDPVAGIFQDYWRFADQGVYGKRKGGWFTDMFAAGFEGDDLATAVKDPCRRAELDDAGLVRLLSPEQVERKVGAVFGEKWGKLSDQLATLYGGIDSKEVTDRAADPSGAMGAIQRTLSND